MDADHFDALIRSLQDAAPRRTVVGGVLGAGVATLLTRLGTEDAKAGRKKGKKKKCRGAKKKCGRKCIPKDDCCTDVECGVNERCAGGTCETCLPQGSDCTDDAQCCTDICDTYTEKCQQVRVNCTDGEPCPNGRCCEIGLNNKQCLYVKATQLECVPDGEPNASCGYVVCGDACSDFDDGSYEFCGFEGSAACRNGRCCCPQGIPLEDCPSFKVGETFLPRCPN